VTEEQQQMLEDCANRPRKMTEWEENFVNDLMTKDASRFKLSPRQEEVLNRIWDKVTS
jgi:hypothetical protein